MLKATIKVLRDRYVYRLTHLLENKSDDKSLIITALLAEDLNKAYPDPELTRLLEEVKSANSN